MKDEEAQVTLRRASGSAAGSSGVETPFQRAPRPSSQPPGSSESSQLRRSVREIRRSFEAGAADSAESSPFSKPLANSRRSFHFEKQSLSWDSSDSDGRKTASNGGTPVTSPIKEVTRGSGSKIPVRGGEDKVSTGDRKVGSGDEKNGPSKSAEGAANPTDGVKSIVSPTHGLPHPRTLNEVVVVQTEFIRIDRRGENQDISDDGENRTIQERFDYVLPKSTEKDAANGSASDNSKMSELTNGTRVDALENKKTSMAERMDEQVGRPSRSAVKANGVPGTPLGGPHATTDTRSDSPSSQKLSATDAAESLEKSKSQIDKLQANLKTPLSSETVSTLKAELSTKSKVPMATKIMPIPKSMSLPSRITSYLNGLEKKSQYQGQNMVSGDSGREGKEIDTSIDAEKYTAIDSSPEGKVIPSGDETTCPSDSKSNLKAQFLKTEVKEKKERVSLKEDEDQQKSIITVKTIPVQQVLPLCSPVSSPSRESTSSPCPQLKTPKDISFSVTSDVSSAKDGAIIVSSVASAVLYPSKGNQDLVSKETSMLTNGEDKVGSDSWSKEEHYTVENSNTSYKLIKTTTVVSQKPNVDAQESLHIMPTTPRVVGVEIKKGVDAPEKDMHQGDLIRKQLTPQGDKDKKHTQIPVLVDRGNKSSFSQAKEESKTGSNPKDSSPEKNVMSPTKAEEYKTFLECAKREEMFANEMEVVAILPDNGLNHVGTSTIQNPASQDLTQKDSREGGHDESRETLTKEMERRNGEASGAGTASDIQRSSSDDVDKAKAKESPKDEKGGKKMGFMMAVLGGLKDSSKKKKTVVKEAMPKPKVEIKKRRGRVGPPLTEEEIKAMELEAEVRRKKREEEERRAQANKTEEKAQSLQQKSLEKVNEEKKDGKSSESLANLLGDDDDERSAVRRDAYAELLKKLAKAVEDQEDDAGGGEETDESREIGEKTEEDTEGSDTAVEEDEEEDEETIELRRQLEEDMRESENRARGKPPIAPVPSVRTTSLTARSISRAPTSPTIMEGEVVTTPMRPTPIAPSSSPVPENVIRSKTASEESIPRRRTLIETAFIGRDGDLPHEDHDRQSASSRLLRTPSPGLSRIPHTSMILEERLRRRSESAERGTRRSTSLSPPPVTSPVGRNRGGSNLRYLSEDLVGEENLSPEDIEVDRHRPLKQCLNPPAPQPKKPAKTFLQRILRQSPPPPPPPPVKKQPKSPKLPPLRPRFIYDDSDLRTPQTVQIRDPKTSSLPMGAVPPRGPANDQRLRSLSPPTTHAEYHAMQVHYQRTSLQSLNHYGSQRMNSMSPPPLTSNRAVGAVRPQPLSYSDIPGRMQYDPRSRSLSPQDAGVTRTATLPNKLNLFVRGSPARTTIPNGEGIAQRKVIVERAGSTSTLPNPIFKRGASSEDSVCSAPAGSKKVSFSCSTPTKAEREQMRMMQLREWQRRAREQYSSVQYGDDDVFIEAPNKPLPPTPRRDEMDGAGRKWLRAATTAGSPRQMEVSPTGVSESESGSEAGEVRRIMRRRYPDKDDEWGADGKSRGLPGTDQPGGIPGSRGAVVGGLGGGSGDELEVRRGGGGRPRRDEPRRHTLSHGGSVGGDEVHHHHHHHHHHRGGAPQTGSLARSMDLENNNKMADNGDAFLARMRRKVPLTTTPMTPTASPQLQYIRHQQRPPHPPSNTSLPGYGKTPLPRGSSSGSGSYYPPGMPGGGGGGHGTLDPRSVGHGGMMMGGGGMMYEDDDPGIMSEVETASTGFRRGGKQRSSLPVVRTPSKTLERPLGLVFLQYRNETKRALLPNEITSIDTVKALFVRSFPKQLTMEYLDSPLVKIYIHDSSKDMFYELEDLRSHLRDIRDRSVLRLFESDVNGGPGGGVMPGGMVPVPGPSPAPVPLWDQDQSYFSEPEFDSEYHHQHIHKTKGSKGGSGAPSPYYMTHSYPPGAQPGQPGVVVPPGGGGGPVGGPASSATLPRGPLLRAYSPATERIKPMPPTDRMHGESGYMSSPERGRPYPPYPSPSPAVPPAVPPTGGPPGVAPPYEDPYYGQYGGARSGSITPVIDEEASDSEMMDNSYSLYGGVKMGGRPLAAPQARPFPPTAAMPAAAVPYDVTRIRVEHMERQLANLTGLVQKALTQGRPTAGGSGPISGVPPGQSGAPDGASPGNYLQVPASRDAYRNDETYIRSDTKPPKLGKGRDKSVSFEKSVSFSDEPPDMSSPKQHSPQHAERDHRHKPAPPPKPVSLSPGQYEGRHIYRDLHLTPEMYNQLRILQRKAKDLRQEVRNLRRMSQAQAHSVRETIRDTFIKIRAMLLTGGETWLHQQQIIDADRLRTSREEELYKQEMLRLEKDLTELESTVEELRGNVINRKTRVNMSDVENMALILSKSSKTVADLKVRFPSLQDGMKSILSSEMEKVVREEKFLKEEPERLENALRRCKKLTGTLVTLKRLASVQEQRLPSGNSSIDARLSPTLNDGPAVPVGNERGGSVSSSLGSPVSGSPGPNSKPATVPTGSVVAAKPGGGAGSGGNSGNQQGGGAGQRPESALDALLDELQTFSRPPSRSGSRKGSMDGGGAPVAANPAAAAPAGALQNSGQGTLRRLHSYPSSDSVGSPVKTAPATVQRLQVAHDGTPVSMEGGGDAPQGGPTATGGKLSPKPPVPERSSDLLARRVPPPPPPRTSSRSPLVSPTSPPNHSQQHRPQPPLPSQSSTSSSASSHSSSSAASSSSSSSGPPPATLPRCMPRRSSTPTRNPLRETNPAAAAAAAAAEEEEAIAVEEEERKRRAARREHLSSNSSSSESVNSQEGLQQRKGSGGSGSGGSSKARQEALEQRHRELLRKQKQLQEQYARLQQLQRGGAAAPGCPGFTGPQVGDLKKTGSESNLLARMGHLGLSAAPATSGSLTHLAPQSVAPLVAEKPNPVIRETSTMTTETTNPASSAATVPTTPTSGKIYETDIL